MSKQIFTQQNSLFSYSGVNCVRNDYYHHGCQICVDICPEYAFSIVRNKLSFNALTCNACAGCIGSCPTEALALKSFDPNRFVQEQSTASEELISCKINTPCLGVFDSHHFIIMALEHKDILTCDMSHCEGCSVNKEGKVQDAINEKISDTNDFFALAEASIRLHVKEEIDTQDSSKRALFRKAISDVSSEFSETSVFDNFTVKHQNRIDTSLAAKNLLLNEAITRHIEQFTQKPIVENTPLFTQKSINFDTCTLCKDCIQFCPTEALFLSSDKQGIFFTHAKCIGCGICNHICKSDAITTKEGFDLLSIAMNRSEALVHYEMVRCNECKTPYAYKGGEPICQRCQSFMQESADMFTLARDL